MIAKLTGVLDSVTTGGVVIDVGGVGYLAFCPARSIDRLGPPGSRVTLFVETHVREDHIHLYGFADSAEREWFRLLTGVQGVGGRVALAILGVLSPDALTAAIAAQDRVPLTRADGVGPKLATRIVTELKDRVGGLALTATASGSVGTDVPAAVGGAAADAISALVNLGYGRTEAFGAVGKAAQRLGADVPPEHLIPAALKELAS
ncbi:MAG: Holliday junction branch migration protein RuvA [Inquilinaceae bacterium]